MSESRVQLTIFSSSSTHAASASSSACLAGCSADAVDIRPRGLSASIASGQFPNQPPQDPADALRNMFESFAKESERFVPGMFSELSPEQMERLEKIKITPREESAFGQDVIKRYEAMLKTRNESITRSGKDVEYLTTLAKTLRANMKNADRYKTLDIAVVDSTTTDAYSVPGGHLIFTSGLLNSLQSEAELAGIMAHELSHLDRGHQLLALKQSKTTPNWNEPSSAMAWMSTMFKPFRPEFESQADADAVEWMMAAGYDPRELARLLNRWDVKQDQQAPWTKMLPSFARSHPDSGRRAQKILDDYDKAVDQRKPAAKQKLVIGKRNFAERTPASVRKFPE